MLFRSVSQSRYEVQNKDDSKKVSELFRQVEETDLVKFGLIPEFIGRLPVIATLEELDEEALMQILTEPKNALTRQYQYLFTMEDVDLVFDASALRAVAKKALERNTGARGLRSILENVLLETMYDLQFPQYLHPVHHYNRSGTP